MSKVGRRKKEYPEDKIKGIILSFVEDKGIRSEIPKRTLSEYAKKLFREGSIPWLDEEISDNYWVRTERRGFQLIEEYNAIVPKTLSQNSCNTVQLPKIEEIIKEHCKDLKQLQKNLFPYEKELTLSQDKNNALQDEINQLKERLNERNICIAALERKIKLQQETIFKLFNHGAVSNPKIRNLMEMGEEMDAIVKDAFQNIFNLKADQFLSMDFDSNRNVVNIDGQQPKRSLLDDFKNL
ncbi:hypothetical protein BCH308197_2181 [Bacillus cereus H3081.97]|uniref:hypothetical protein n=1 Tax=Bacillus cereus group TaxID=86661 RepID=UPI00016B854C|nr:MULTISPECIES: hypothetical protein [Bacillus cereus group]AEW55266.1 hypothetical protein bcf_10720 [Bacillus cereus F837/76]EDZ57994.1 hypothetical protein BCH308197_2181 [Bacillus cereus H3081.97]KKZ91872.1 hypothetical protein B4086_2102 [Bacillus cereus]MCC2372366.1 hypothetical protein [Bacillus paranthracis]